MMVERVGEVAFFIPCFLFLFLPSFLFCSWLETSLCVNTAQPLFIILWDDSLGSQRASEQGIDGMAFLSSNVVSFVMMAKYTKGIHESLVLYWILGVLFDQRACQFSSSSAYLLL